MSECRSEKGIKENGNNNTSGYMGWKDTTASRERELEK